MKTAKRKIAVLLTGVMHDCLRCVQSLQFLLEDWEVDYFAVLREEFATPDAMAELKAVIPAVEFIIVPQAETENALKPFANFSITPTAVMMWHEIAYAAGRMGKLKQYDLVLRSRYDIFFHHQYLPEINGNASDVWLPGQMSWSGANDMLCVAAPEAFTAYAQTFQRLQYIVAVEEINVPEAIMARSLALASLREQPLDVRFILYRGTLHEQFSDSQLCVMADRDPNQSAYKFDDSEQTAQLRAEYAASVTAMTELEAYFPLHETWHAGFNFYPVEIDERDGSHFRWLGMHGHINRPLNRHATGISFQINFSVPGWNLSDLTVLVDGVPVTLDVTSVDELGRPQVSGRFTRPPSRRPWSKIGFSSKRQVVPSAIGENPHDHRALSIAISDFKVLEAVKPAAVAGKHAR